MNTRQKGATYITGCIVTYNNAETIVKCIDTLFSYNKKKYKMVLYIVDNGSTDGTIELIRERYPKVKLILSNQNLGFGKGHNLVLPYLKEGRLSFCDQSGFMLERRFGCCRLILWKVMQMRLPPVHLKSLIQMEAGSICHRETPSLRYVLFSKIPFLTYLRKEYTREKYEFRTADRN